MQPIPSPLFMPECYADTALMRTLLRENSNNRAQLNKLSVNHQHGIGNVGNKMEAQWSPGTARRVLGMVDLDREFGQQPYLSQFSRVLGGSNCAQSRPARLAATPATSDAPAPGD